MTSRLDRLFLLLDQGSSQITRKAAALQLGEVQKLHPHELNNLLAKVRSYLHSSSWDTRIAAGLAVEAIVKHVPHWLPPGLAGGPPVDNNVGRMTFSNFDVNTVIRCGRDLLASEGTEYDVSGADSVESGDFREKLALQRQLLNQRLGLNIAQRLSIGINSSDIVSNEDLAVSQSNYLVRKPETNCNNSLDMIIPKKRNLSATESIAKKIKAESDESSLSDSVVDFSCLKEWPLASFADELMNDLFNALWEVRHGAATALREIVKQHGKCGGRLAEAPSDQMDQLNQSWLEDLALRLFCVLALDKFGDFVSDQVVAPVRETCAQALGSIFGFMFDENIYSSVQILLQLLKRQEWEARHGGLLGLKYLLAVRQDLTPALLPLVFEPIFNGLNDPEDDVSAVAASALIPVKESLINTLPEKVPILLEFLWNALLEIDDLTSSTSNILMLLSSLLNGYSKESMTNLQDLVPRLWPFLCHHLSDVRRSVLEALYILTAEELSFMDVGLLSHCLRFLYQRSLTEPKANIMELLYKVWENLVLKSNPVDLIAASCPLFNNWICFMMHPARIAIDPATIPAWLEFTHLEKNQKMKNKADIQLTHSERYMLAGNDTSDSQAERDRCVVRARLQAAKFIGLLTSVVTTVVYKESPSPLECITNILLFHLGSKGATQRLCSAWIIKEWSLFQKASDFQLPDSIILKCMECLQESIFFEEISSSFARLHQDARELVSLLKQHNLTLDENVHKPGAIYNFQQIGNLVASDYNLAITSAKAKPKPKVLESLEDKRKIVSKAHEEIVCLQDSLSITVLASLATALVAWNHLPEKLNPIVRPLMDSLKREENEQLQKSSAVYLTKLLDLCSEKERSNNLPSPVLKIIKNLISFLCCSQESSFPSVSPFAGGSLSKPSVSSNPGEGNGSSSPATPLPESAHSIIALHKMQRAAEKVSQMRRSNSLNAKKHQESVAAEELSGESRDTIEKHNEIMKRGATTALREIVQFFGSSLESKLPTLWERITFVSKVQSEDEEVIRTQTEDLKSSLMLLEVVAPFLHNDLHSHLITFLPCLCNCLASNSHVIRHLAARCLGVFSTVVTGDAMSLVLDKVLDMLGASDSELKRQGGTEAVYYVIERLGINVVPYIVLLIVPMLGRMSDQNDDVRTLATHCFAQLVQLMPLDTNTVNLHTALLQRKKEEQHFLDQLMNPKNLDDYKVPVPINAELRSYQQQGVNWLAFLNKYKLHGILCDEMGLGKTLMSLCMLASDHHRRSEKYTTAKSPDSKPLPSLVICPPTLTGHWVYEVEKFVDSTYLCPLNYSGPPAERARLRSKLKRQNSSRSYNLVIASYDIVRNDIEFFSSVHWNYCILDEGHIIKNGRTKLSKAIKSLSANHRVILTGTPIQNNVLELWSLFDFLIPGFLGTERQFMARYSKPILQSRDAKASSKEQEMGVLAMESLHRQVLPFILRRMKEDVLKDLPPKIMQDYYCDLSPLQSHLYEDFSKSRVRQSLESSLGDGNDSANINKTHIFQALQYLRKVCNHPKLVLTPQHPEYENVTRSLRDQNSSLSDITHAAKLCALKQLLLDCGIGCQTSSNLISESEPIVNQHRALIFCQLKGMLDILENDLFKQNMPSVTYLRLDGSVPPSSRHSVVHTFNNDPSIDVLLLTTQVGGLGLNLTGADTVIFVEHDWNPMKDLQAMDRAHRIGQKKVVNVYRLITTGTLEEKIMGLQKFKLTIANTVISQENARLETMRTDQLLDLFQLNSKEGHNENQKASKAGSSVKSILENLPELWDTEQYEKEYDLSNFIQSLKC